MSFNNEINAIIANRIAPKIASWLHERYADGASPIPPDEEQIRSQIAEIFECTIPAPTTARRAPANKATDDTYKTLALSIKDGSFTDGYSESNCQFPREKKGTATFLTYCPKNAYPFCSAHSSGVYAKKVLGGEDTLDKHKAKELHEEHLAFCRKFASATLGSVVSAEPAPAEDEVEYSPYVFKDFDEYKEGASYLLFLKGDLEGYVSERDGTTAKIVFRAASDNTEPIYLEEEECLKMTDVLKAILTRISASTVSEQPKTVRVAGTRRVRTAKQ